MDCPYIFYRSYCSTFKIHQEAIKLPVLTNQNPLPPWSLTIKLQEPLTTVPLPFLSLFKRLSYSHQSAPFKTEGRPCSCPAHNSPSSCTLRKSPKVLTWHPAKIRHQAHPAPPSPALSPSYLLQPHWPPWCSGNTANVRFLFSFSRTFFCKTSTGLTLSFHWGLLKGHTLREAFLNCPTLSSIPCHLYSLSLLYFSSCPFSMSVIFFYIALLFASFLLWNINAMREELPLFSTISPVCRLGSHTYQVFNKLVLNKRMNKENVVSTLIINAFFF